MEIINDNFREMIGLMMQQLVQTQASKEEGETVQFAKQVMAIRMKAVHAKA